MMHTCTCMLIIIKVQTLYMYVHARMCMCTMQTNRQSGEQGYLRQHSGALIEAEAVDIKELLYTDANTCKNEWH